MRPRASFQTNQARWQLRYQLDHVIPPHCSTNQHLTAATHSVHGKHVLCAIDPNGSNLLHGLPLSISIETTQSQSWHAMPLWDGESLAFVTSSRADDDPPF
jgi:hypothetical protein